MIFMARSVIFKGLKQKNIIFYSFIYPIFAARQILTCYLLNTC